MLFLDNVNEMSIINCAEKITIKSAFIFPAFYMDFHRFFTQLGFTEKEAEIFLALYKLGTKPASSIASYLHMERTSVYKSLLKLTQEGVVLETKVRWVTHFFVPEIRLLKKYMLAKKEELQHLEDNFGLIEAELAQYDASKYSYIPKISLFDGEDGIKNLFNDIYDTTIKHQYLVIKFFATNTFEAQVSVGKKLKDYYENIFAKLQKQKVLVEAYLGNGVMIMEQISKTTNIQNLSELPAGNSTMNIFVVGEVVYLIIFKELPFGIKIDSRDFSSVMHFLFEKLQSN